MISYSDIGKVSLQAVVPLPNCCYHEIGVLGHEVRVRARGLSFYAVVTLNGVIHSSRTSMYPKSRYK